MTQNNRTNKTMNRNVLNYIVDLVGFAFMLMLAGTGIIIRYILPPGTGGGNRGSALVLWGMDRHQFGDLHTVFAVGIAVVLIVHLTLHWSWVCRISQKVVGKRDHNGRISTRTAACSGLVLILVITLGGWAFLGALSPVSVARAPASRESGAVQDQERSITGRMTLEELSRRTGISVETIKMRLGLPDEISPKQRLGRLKRQYGFEMGEVRQVVAAVRE